MRRWLLLVCLNPNLNLNQLGRHNPQRHTVRNERFLMNNSYSGGWVPLFFTYSIFATVGTLWIVSPFWSCSSSIVKTKRDPSNSAEPTLSQFILYSWVSCLPIILIFVGRLEYNVSTFWGSLVPNKDLRLLIKYLTATFLWACPSTGIFSLPVSMVNWRFAKRCDWPAFIQKFCGHHMDTK